MAPPSRAATDTNRCCAWTGLRSDTGSAGAICAVVGATLAAVPEAQTGASLLTLALLTAGGLMVAGALRVTLLQRLFPEPARVGFLAGTGVTVAVTQSAELALAGQGSLALGVGSIALLLMLRCLGLRASAALLLLALTMAASAAFDLERRGVRVLGSTSLALSAPFSAQFEGRTWVLLTVAALSIAVLASARPLTAAEPCTSHPAIGVHPGVRRADAWAGVLSILTLALSNVLAQLPLATISAILIVVSLGGIDVRRLSQLRQASPRDFRIALAAAFGVTIFGLCWGVAIGVAAALGDMFRHPMPPEVSSSVANEPLGVIGARANRRYCSPMAACRGRARARAALGRPARSVRWRVDRRGARVRSARESRTSRSLATGKVRS
jgi:MFS superfamily sulfate permease-like transporter